MTLLFLTVLACVVVFFLVRRDRLYLKKETRDVVSIEMKKRLNIPVGTDEFPKEFAKKDYSKTTSAKVMREMNVDSRPSSVDRRP